MSPSSPSQPGRRSTSAAAKDCIGRTSASATASSSRPTAGAPGTHVGLRDVQQVGRIVVHPTEPRPRASSPGMGHPYGPNEERGVFRSTQRRPDLGEGPLRRSEHRRQPGRVRSSRTRTSCTRRSGSTARARGRTAASPARTAGCTSPRTADSTWQKLGGGLPTRPTGLGRISLRRRAERSAPALRAGQRRAPGSRRLSIGRWGRELAAGELGPAARRRHPRASEEPGRCVRRRHGVLPVRRRRPDVDVLQGRARRRRLPADLDQPDAARHHALHRRSGRHDHHQRRPDLELLVQPADRAALSRHDRQPVSVLDLRRPAGERRHRHRQPRQRRTDLVPRLDRRRRRRVRATSRPIR